VSQRREAAQSRRGHDHSDLPLRPLPFRLKLDPSHPYLAGRHISPELAATFGLGYCSHGTMKGRICIPTTTNAVGSWHTPADGQATSYPKMSRNTTCHAYSRSDVVLFNLHRVTGADHLVLVEGYWSVFRLHALGAAAVALMRRALSAEQETPLIESGVRMLTLMLDGEPARQGSD
jgi:hypothetical protein